MRPAVRVLVTWLLSIAVTFVIGDLVIVVVPSVASNVVGVGVAVNLALALLAGGGLGYSGECEYFGPFVLSGTAVVIAGIELLSVTGAYSVTPSGPLAFTVLVDGFFGAIGMSLLVVVGFFTGTVMGALWGLSDRHRPRRLPPPVATGPCRRAQCWPARSASG